jgi:(1->4)-alpha-D-glucan 1-alpha-D-glucosylmutase
MPNSNQHTPRATYRLQLRPGFGFQEAAEIADYLEALGVSHVYCSPYLQAAPGSTHGYDCLDHQSVNAELGGTIGHEQFCNTLGQHHLGQVLDVVPNHMSIAHARNRWWWDVLENGPSSRYAAYFDVDWEPHEQKLHNRVLMPILGDHYGRCIESGEIQLAREGGSFHIRYADHTLPLAPRTLDDILLAAASDIGSDLLEFIADTCANLPPANRTDYRSVSRRHRDKEIIRRTLEHELHEHPDWGTAIDGVLAKMNASPELLDALLERQNYRLAFWRTAQQDLDYRRFFDINTLVGLHMEDERVFFDTHALVLHWLGRGVIDGLRIDHPDGLRDPQQYFERLLKAAPKAWTIGEKILMPDERLPCDWPIAGTTGYDFLNRVMRLFIDPRAEGPLTEFYAEFTGESTDYAALARDKKHQVMRELFASDIHRLTNQLAEICEQRRRYRDYTRRELNQMLREVIANLAVYRTYVRAEEGVVNDTDRETITAAITAAKENRPELDPELFDFFGSIVLLATRGPAESELVMRFQQSTGPVMAKGVEDTLFYCYNRFIALNEVGSEPNRFSISVEDFHRTNIETFAHHPHTMLATTTHDTKRGEDVRARLALLSEIPDRWAAAVRAWSAHNDQYRTQFQPDRNIEYLYYQTLVGAWPIELDRIRSCLIKSAREAKQNTNWTAPNDAYEAALKHFIEASLDDAKFRAMVADFVQPLIQPGRINSLAQTLLKLTSPGIPDTYQGSELWDLRLVDPDNRRPVDFAARRTLLQGIDELPIERILSRAGEALPKLWLIKQSLSLRRQCPEVFDRGAYEPITAAGAKADHVIAFSRAGQVITIVPRLILHNGSELFSSPHWQDTTLTLPPGQWQNRLTGDKLPAGPHKLSALLSRFPVALLVKS